MVQIKFRIRRNRLPGIDVGPREPRRRGKDAAPGPPGSVRSRLLFESPLLLGLALALALLWQRSELFVITDYPMGLDWSEYFLAAWDVVHRVGHNYPSYRQPLYPAFLGSLGEIVGYGAAASTISSAATVTLVISAGVAARALANPWAGGLAALSVPFVAPTIAAVGAANFYPALAAATAAAIAASLCAARWPNAGWYLLAGLSAGVAWGIDLRGLLVLPSALLLGFIGLTRVPRPASRWLVAGAFVASVLIMGPGSQRLLRVRSYEPPQSNLSTQVNNNDVLVRGTGGDQGITWAPDGVVDACKDSPSRSRFGPATAFDRCGRAIMEVNAETLAGIAPFGGWITLLCIPLLLVPIRRQWGRFGATLAWLAVPAAFLLLFFGWIVVPYRYMAQIAGPLAAIVPVAIARLIALCPRHTRLPAHVVAFTGAGLFLVVVSPSADSHPEGVSMAITGEQDHVRFSPMLQEIQRQVDPEDVLVDCSAKNLGLALLPVRNHPCRLIDAAARFDGTKNEWPGNDSIDYCLSAARLPPTAQGQTWMLTAVPPMRRLTPPETEPGAVPILREAPSLLDAPWTRAHAIQTGMEELILWRHGGGVGADHTHNAP